MKDAEKQFRDLVDQAHASYSRYLEREIREGVRFLSHKYPGVTVRFDSCMGTYFLSTEPANAVIDEDEMTLVDLLDGAFDDYGWIVIPTGLWRAKRGALIEESS